MNAMRKSLLAAALMIGLSGPAMAAGEAAKADLDILVNTIRANRKALVAANLALTDDEAKKFWPVYDAYQKKLAVVQDRMVKLIEEYSESFGSMTDEKALELADEFLEIETARAKVRRDALDDVSEALPGKKVARFFQIENKMDAVVRYDLAATIPVVE